MKQELCSCVHNPGPVTYTGARPLRYLAYMQAQYKLIPENLIIEPE
jgi:hypothetical protein